MSATSCVERDLTFAMAVTFFGLAPDYNGIIISFLTPAYKMKGRRSISRFILFHTVSRGYSQIVTRVSFRFILIRTEIPPNAYVLPSCKI